MAADARHFETRRDLYVDVALHFARLHQWAVAVEPIVDIGQNEPSLPSDDEAGLLLDARTAALASPEVNQAVRNCSDAFRRFFHMGVNTFRSIRGQLGIGDPQTASAMETMETLRGRFVEEVSRLETLLRKELWSLK